VTSSAYDVVHFSGHAVEQIPGALLSAQALVLGEANDTVSADALTRMGPMASGPRLLFLSACNTHRLAQQIAAYIPNVIGMREWVSTDFCVTFANGFYRVR
jgi:CHAT domain-containing protein